MYKLFSEDLDCGEVKGIELVGSGAVRAYRLVMSAFKSGKPGIYLLVGGYGSGKTLILRKVSLDAGGRIVIRSLKHIDADVNLSCSSGRNILGYALDNVELLFQEPERYRKAVVDYITISKYYPVVFSMSIPIFVNNVDKISDIVEVLGRIPRENIINIEYSEDEVKQALSRIGVRLSEDEAGRLGIRDFLRSPGLALRAIAGSSRLSKGDEEPIQIIVI